MADYYHEILELPFVNFTLTHFNRWRNLLANSKKHRFKNTTPSGFIQVVYYHLAVRNHSSAEWFLSLCDKSDNQVIFLKILLWFYEKKNNGKVSYTFFDSLYVSLIDLGVAGYAPAMFAIGHVRLELRTIKYDNKMADEMNSIIGKLDKIVQNLIEIDADAYNIDILKRTICAIGSNTNLDLFYIDPVNILCMARSGSNAALLSFFNFALQGNNIKHFGKFSEEHKLEFKKLLMERILEPNYPIIAVLLDVYPTILEKGANLTFGISDVVIKAIDQVNLYFVSGCEHIGLIESYLSFRIRHNISFDLQYESICKMILLKCYANGYLFYYLYPHFDERILKTKNKDDEQSTDISIYQEIDKNDVTDEHVAIMADLVINIFWSREICKGVIPAQGFFIGNRMFMFRLLLKINSLLWKAAVCVFGINFINTSFSFSKDVLNIYRNPMCVRQYRPFFKDRYFNGHLNDDFAHIMRNVQAEVSDHENIYREELMEEIDVKTLDAILNKCKSLLVDINSGYFDNVYHAVFLLAEIDILSQTYRCRLDLHMKYRPGSKYYLLTRDAFCKRILN